LLKGAISIYEKGNHDASFDKAKILGQMGHNAKRHKEHIRNEEALENYREALRFRQKHYGQHLLTAFAHIDLADYYLYID